MKGRLFQRLREANPSITRTRIIPSDYKRRMRSHMEITSESHEETCRRNRIRNDVYGNHYGWMQPPKPFDLKAALDRDSDNTTVDQSETESKQDSRTVVQKVTNSDSDNTTVDQNETESKQDSRTVVQKVTNSNSDNTTVDQNDTESKQDSRTVDQNAINSGSDNTKVGQDGNGSRQDGSLETQVPAQQEQEWNLKIRRRRDAIDKKRAEWLYAGDADGGDAAADAGIVEYKDPDDQNIFIDLYGLEHNEVFQLMSNYDHDSISILNARATHKAQRVKAGEPVPPEIETAFRKYITVLRENWGKLPEKDEYASDLGKAYFEFWDAHDAHEEHKQ